MSKNEPFAPWQCPLCGEKLTGDSTLKCTKGHCFDRAKEGYWHLLPVQSMRTKAPGDSKEMVAARRAFLNARSMQWRPASASRCAPAGPTCC